MQIPIVPIDEFLKKFNKEEEKLQLKEIVISKENINKTAIKDFCHTHRYTTYHNNDFAS